MKKSLQLLCLAALALCNNAVAEEAMTEETLAEETVAEETVADEFDEVEVPAGPYDPQPEGGVIFVDNFQSDEKHGVWKLSNDEKYANQEWRNEELPDSVFPGDKAMIVGAEARHYGLTALFDEPALNTDKNLVLQFEVAFTEGITCGGAYMKFLDAEGIEEAEGLNADTPYVIMFGPDQCGTTNKIHLIIRHKNPVSGEWEEKHLKTPPAIPNGWNSHLYTAVINNDNTFQVLLDGEVKREGSLLDEFDPPFNPPSEIDDPEDFKPEDWVDAKTISDPEASKPDDWDEDAPFEIEDADASKPASWLDDASEYIEDPEAEVPDDWDEEEDGEWEAPLIPNTACEAAAGCGEWVRPMKRNPDYKGKWSAPMIDNPEYIGEWAPSTIANPNYFVDETPCNLPAIGGAAIEIWTMSAGIAFDNVLVTYDKDVAASYTEQTWKLRSKLEKERNVKRREEEAELEREELLAAGDKLAIARFYALEVFEWLKANPIGSVTAILGIFIFIMRMVFSSKSNNSEETEEIDEAVEVKEDEDEAVVSAASPAASGKKSKKKSKKAKKND